MLGTRLDQGYRLACQLWVEEDLELAQETPAAAASPKPAGSTTAS